MTLTDVLAWPPGTRVYLTAPFGALPINRFPLVIRDTDKTAQRVYFQKNKYAIRNIALGRADAIIQVHNGVIAYYDDKWARIERADGRNALNG